MIDINKKVAIVTGANSGMGKATVAAIADQGYKVVMLCRNKERGEEALEDLMEKSGRDIQLMLCDLGDMDKIRSCADEIKMQYSRVDVLVNNAGVISLNKRWTADGLEEQFGVNHIGHFLLTLRLLDLMETGSRIVIVSSGAHKVGRIHFDDYNLNKGFNAIKAYSQSKLANILFTRELAQRLRSKGITVNCCHPGMVGTSIAIDRNTGFGSKITVALKKVALSPEEGAQTAIYLAIDPEVSKVTGKYYYKCRKAKTCKAAKSKAVAKQLFELSEIITGEYHTY